MDNSKNLGKYLHKPKAPVNTKLPKNGTSKPKTPQPAEGGVRG